jgi:hypothetical protein
VKGPNEWDGENKGVTQITFEVPMPSAGDAHLAVTFSRFQKTQLNFQESQ